MAILDDERDPCLTYAPSPHLPADYRPLRFSPPRSSDDSDGSCHVCFSLNVWTCLRCKRDFCREHAGMEEGICEDCGGREKIGLREAVDYMAEQVLLPLAGGTPDYSHALRQVIEQQRELIRRMDETIAKMGVR